MPAKIITEEEFNAFTEKLFDKINLLEQSLKRLEQAQTPEFYTAAAVAKKIGQSVATVRRLTLLDQDDRWYLKAIRTSRRGAVKIAPEDLEDFLKRIEVGTSYRGGKYKHRKRTI